MDKINKTVQYQRSVLAKNIKSLLTKKKKTQTDMARELGIAETTVSSWMNCERYPRLEKIQLMADYFCVKRSDLTEEKLNANIPYQVGVHEYPYYQFNILNNLPIEPTSIETFSLPDSFMGKWAGSNEVYFTRTNGESMNKLIPNNSLIAVKNIKLSELKNEDIVLYSNNSEYSVKRFYNDGINKRLIFRPYSTNYNFTDFTVPYEQVKNVIIHGKVILYTIQTKD